MIAEFGIDLFSEAIRLVILMVLVLVVPSLIVGLLVSTFQAATQINEQTLSFLPRFIITMISLVIAGPWLFNEVIDFTRNLFTSMPSLIG